jgi:hypothetical protein
MRGKIILTMSDLFIRIRSVFSDLGILGKTLSLEYEGICYRVSCDEDAFMVYRVNDSGLKHHMPGWPICLVSSEMTFEECCAPGLGRDHFTCPVDIEKWLELIALHCRCSLNDDILP